MSLVRAVIICPASKSSPRSLPFTHDEKCGWVGGRCKGGCAGRKKTPAGCVSDYLRSELARFSSLPKPKAFTKWCACAPLSRHATNTHSAHPPHPPPTPWPTTSPSPSANRQTQQVTEAFDWGFQRDSKAQLAYEAPKKVLPTLGQHGDNVRVGGGVIATRTGGSDGRGGEGRPGRASIHPQGQPTNHHPLDHPSTIDELEHGRRRGIYST